MRRWFWAWRKASSLSQPGEEIVEEFGFAEPASDDGDRFKHREDGLVFSFKYEWHIRSEEGAYRVTEKAFASWVWWLCAGVSLWACMIAATVFVISTGVLELVFLVLTPVLLINFLTGYVALLRRRSPVYNLIEPGSSHELYMPVASYLLPVLAMMFIVVFTTGTPRITALVASTVVLTVYSFWHDELAEFSFRWQSWMTDRTKNLPMVAGKYVGVTALNTGSLLLFLIIYDGPAFVLLMNRFPWLVTFIVSIIFIGYFGLTRSNLLYTDQISEISRFKQKGRNIGSRNTILTTAFVSVAVSFVFVYVSYRFLVVAPAFISVFRTWPALVLVLVASIPILYAATGLLYQLYTTLVGSLNLYNLIEYRDFSNVYDTDAEVYLLESDDFFAGAAIIGFRDVIVVSKGMVELLNDDELAAILAHEESHIDRGENRLATGIALLSPLFLTAKNVLYAIFDFRGREYRADREAAQKTNRDDLVDALQKLQVAKARKKTWDSNSFDSLIPTLTSFNDQDRSIGIWQRYFGFFYGGFAVSEVHPSLDERIQQLQD